MSRTTIRITVGDEEVAADKARRMLAGLKYKYQDVKGEMVYKRGGILNASRCITFSFEDHVMVVEAWVRMMGLRESGIDDAGAALPKILLMRDLDKLRLYTEELPEEPEEDEE